MHISMKFTFCVLLLLLCCGIYKSYASFGAEAAPINATVGDCICGRQYTPVCGSDAKTYSNRCMYECARKKLNAMGRSLELVRTGACAGESLRRKHVAAVAPLVAAVADEDKDEGEDKDMESCFCDRSLIPVCGSDNRTYNNRCLFECKRSILARLGKVLTILRQGVCN